MRHRLISRAVVLLLSVVLGYVYVGFFYPDPHQLDQMSSAQVMLLRWVPRVAIPALYLALVSLLLRGSAKLKQDVAIIAAVTAVLLWLFYPLANRVYESRRSNNGWLEQFHPYLQLNPSIPDGEKLSSSAEGVRIFFLGGSTTEFTDEEGVGWPQRVEARLRAEHGFGDVHAFNLGRQWYTSQHSLINYQANLRHHRPDVVVVMHAINDLLHNADFSYFSQGPFREDYGHFRGPLIHVIGENRSLLGAAWRRFGQLWYNEPREVVHQESFEGIPAFGRNLNALVDLAELDGVRIVFMSQPNLYSDDMSDEVRQACYMVTREAVGATKKWDHETGARGMQVYNGKVETVAGERGIEFIDLEAHVPKTLEFFYDDVHYQDRTFDLIAEVVSREIADRGLLASD